LVARAQAAYLGGPMADRTAWSPGHLSLQAAYLPWYPPRQTAETGHCQYAKYAGCL